jgi:N-acetylmuramoyl-L-alanine amidase
MYKRLLSLALLLMSVAVFVALPAFAAAHHTASTQATVHRIAWGDTLTSIARRYQTSVAILKSLNNLRSDRIIAGRSLRLPGQAAALPRQASASRGIVLSASERSALAKLIYAEAQGEPFKGQVAVAAVVFNRIRDPRFPNTLRGVMYQPFQFEPILNGWAYKPAGPSAYRALDAALAGQDPTNGAVFFYNPVKAPHAWMATRPVVARIGNHVFMR